jgi:hypothetical protein
MLLSEICGLVSVRRPLWREDGSVICSVITQWSESRRTRNHTLLSHLRLPLLGGPGSCIYILQNQGGPVIPTGAGFLLRHLLRLAGLRWRYSNPSRTYILQEQDGPVQSQKSKVKVTLRPMDSQYVLVSSPLGIKGVPSKRVSSRNQEKYIKANFFNVIIRRAAYEACSATWNLGTNSAFALGPRKITENLDRVGRSQDVRDANWLLASSPALNTRALTLVPI